jgi:hypothetical protein
MDAVILKGLGGYGTRAEFIVDAIQERILELTISDVEDAGPPSTPSVATLAGPSLAVAVAPISSGPANVTPTMTALSPPAQFVTIAPMDDLSRPEGLPLFGLHNRDYPSLWALVQLAALTTRELVPAETFYSHVVREAWRFGELLTALEKQSGTKCTALFPTNPEKRKPAEMAFRAFAIGDYCVAGDTFTTTGPLFEWGLVGLTAGDGNEPHIGVTTNGLAILQTVTGLSVEEPHPKEVASTFLDHLARHAPADRRGLAEIVQAIGTAGATRQDVLKHAGRAWSGWTDNEISTNSAGYIARAREWGLVKPKQANGRYNLTSFGFDFLTGEER